MYAVRFEAKNPSCLLLTCYNASVIVANAAAKRSIGPMFICFHTSLELNRRRRIGVLKLTH
jgi:hypothetical protein